MLIEFQNNRKQNPPAGGYHLPRSAHGQSMVSVDCRHTADLAAPAICGQRGVCGRKCKAFVLVLEQTNCNVTATAPAMAKTTTTTTTLLLLLLLLMMMMMTLMKTTTTTPTTTIVLVTMTRR